MMKRRRMFRLKQIIGDPTASPPIEPMVPVSHGTLNNWIREERFPKPVYGSSGIPLWRDYDIERVMDGETDFRESKTSPQPKVKQHPALVEGRAAYWAAVRAGTRARKPRSRKARGSA